MSNGNHTPEHTDPTLKALSEIVTCLIVEMRNLQLCVLAAGMKVSGDYYEDVDLARDSVALWNHMQRFRRHGKEKT